MFMIYHLELLSNQVSHSQCGLNSCSSEQKYTVVYIYNSILKKTQDVNLYSWLKVIFAIVIESLFVHLSDIRHKTKNSEKINIKTLRFQA